MAKPHNKTLIERAKYVISIGEAAIGGATSPNSSTDKVKYRSFVASGLAYLLDLFGDRHPYYTSFKLAVNYSSVYNVQTAIEVIKTIVVEIENGWLATVRSLVTAEIFNDFLEMAEYLLNEGYKDPSAVMIGSVLEEHLRQLCGRHDIPITMLKGDKQLPKKADVLNAELCSKEVYNKLDQKSVISWLDLRNKAAHGKYEEYTQEQVGLMYQGVTNFISRTS